MSQKITNSVWINNTFRVEAKTHALYDNTGLSK